jgi:hypothetical protein
MGAAIPRINDNTVELMITIFFMLFTSTPLR